LCQERAGEVLPELRRRSYALVHHSADILELIPKIREVIGDEKRVRSGRWAMARGLACRR
jgi:hypothetical protein